MEKKINKEPQKGEQCSLPLSDAELRKILTPEQYRIMRENGTEVAFRNAYWDNKKPGLYVDAISGEPLFSSAEKFDSGTGWPSFFKPLEKNAVVEKTDASHGRVRTEVRARKSDSHLGHVFPDGPQPTGLRYCINSASLRFIPVEELEEKGYGQYVPLFLKKEPQAPAPEKAAPQVAVFGTGCFWGSQAAFEKIPGVLKTTVGFMGGHVKDPTYEQVCTHTTGHAEVVRIEFDPSVVPYEKLLDSFWSLHDPTTLNRQGPDIGDQYRSVIFYFTPGQEKAAQAKKAQLERSRKFKEPVVTEISPAQEFYEAETYHQHYYKKRGIPPQCPLPK